MIRKRQGARRLPKKRGSLLQAALKYAARGWRVFPCKTDKAPYIKE